MKGVAYFSKYADQGPSSRYRAYQFQPFFQSQGIDFNIFPLFSNEYLNIIRKRSFVSRTFQKGWHTLSRFRNRMNDLNHLRSDALVIIEQQLFPYLPFWLEHKYYRFQYLLEFDDSIYLTHPHKFQRVIESAAGVIAGNSALASFASRFNRNVHVIPTVLNPKLYEGYQKKKNGRVVIGWSGLEYNFKYLQMLDDVFCSIQKRYPIEIVILSGKRPDNFKFPFEFVKWRSDQEAAQINEFDIGVMPLTDDEWSRGKCGLKLLQYMALGIPSIASPVGVNTEIIQDGLNGFLAETRADWEEKLTLLLNDPVLRERMGEAAKATVIERYSTDVWFPRIVEVYEAYC